MDKFAFLNVRPWRCERHDQNRRINDTPLDRNENSQLLQTVTNFGSEQLH
jgi:hypothetical protein